jgi:hypothetical protein
LPWIGSNFTTKAINEDFASEARGIRYTIAIQWAVGHAAMAGGHAYGLSIEAAQDVWRSAIDRMLPSAG